MEPERNGRVVPLALKPAPRQPMGDSHLYGDVFVKEMFVPDAGTVVPQHAHTYDHISYLAAGDIVVERNGVEIGVFCAPFALLIPARTKHSFRTLADNVLILCLHNAAHGEAADIAEEHHLSLEG